MLEQQEVREQPRELAVAVLEGMDLEEHDGEHADDKQRMEHAVAELRRRPLDQLMHVHGGIGRRRGFEDDPDLTATLVERRHGVRHGLVLPGMPAVLLRLGEEQRVEVANARLDDRDRRWSVDDDLQGVRVAKDLLRVTADK